MDSLLRGRERYQKAYANCDYQIVSLLHRHGDCAEHLAHVSRNKGIRRALRVTKTSISGMTGYGMGEAESERTYGQRN
jgi:hypothetical protein